MAPARTNCDGDARTAAPDPDLDELANAPRPANAASALWGEAMPVEVSDCILCAAPASEFRSFERVRGWNYVRCSACGLVFLNPRPTDAELEHFYNHGYRYDLSRYARSLPSQEIWLDLLEESRGRPGTLLEVGCSYGHFLAEARDRGWSVQGVELNESAVGFGRAVLGLSIEQGRISDLKERNSSTFDAIAAW